MLQEISFPTSINIEHCFTTLFTGHSYFLLNQLIRRKGTGDTSTFSHHKYCIKQNIPAADGLEIVWGCDSEDGLSILRRAILKKMELFICSAQTWN